MRKRMVAPMAVLAVGASASAAWANAGTPLLIFPVLHLLFGNLVIGVAEGLLIGFVFRVRKGPAVFWLVLANYLTAWLGFLALHAFGEDPLGVGRLSIYDVQKGVWGMMALAYAFTLVAEWPFVAAALCKRKHWFRESLLGSVAAQTLTYLGMIYVYGGLSQGWDSSRVALVAPEEARPPCGAILYYVADRDGDVYRRRLDSGAEQKIADTNIADRWVTTVLESSTDTGGWKLRLSTRHGDNRDIPRNAMIPSARFPDSATEEAAAQPPPYAGVARLGSAKNRRWRLRTGFWPSEGIEVWQEGAERSSRLAYANPFVRWHVSNATLLPGDKLIFQLGEHQICLLDLNRRTLARLAHGRGPVVTLERDGTPTRRGYSGTPAKPSPKGEQKASPKAGSSAVRTGRGMQ